MSSTTTITYTQAEYDALRDAFLHQIAELQSRLEVAEKPKKNRSGGVKRSRFGDRTHNEETSRLVDLMTDNGAEFCPVDRDDFDGKGSQCFTNVRKGYRDIYFETLEEALVLMFETLHKKNGAIVHSNKGWGVRSFNDRTDAKWGLFRNHKTITNGGEEWIGWKDGERKEMEAFWKAWKGVDTLPPPQSPPRSPTQKKKKTEKKTEEKEETMGSHELVEVARKQEEERVARNEAEEKANKEAEEAREEEEEDESEDEVEAVEINTHSGETVWFGNGKIYNDEQEEVLDYEEADFIDPMMKDEDGVWSRRVD